MTENKIDEIGKKYRKESVINTVGFFVFGFIVLGVMLGCRTCSEPVAPKSKPIDLTANVCPATGTSSSGKKEKPAGHIKMPEGHPAMAAEKRQSLDSIPHVKGHVVETMNSGRYTYVHIETKGKKVWAAAPEFKVKVGDEVLAPTGMPMKDFKSKTLGRTFDMIYFAGQIIIVDEQQSVE